MLAVKAEYDHGTVRWLQRPPAAKTSCVLVIFDDTSEMPKGAEQNDEAAAWSDFSLDAAMRGMEDEDTPYTADDIKALTATPAGEQDGARWPGAILGERRGHEEEGGALCWR